MKITYKLHDSQFLVFSDPARFIVVCAGRRFGKTVLAIYKAIQVALQMPKANIWMVSPTYRQSEMIAWKMLFELIPEQLIKSKNEVKLLLELINGSEICLKGADNEDSLRGVSLDYCILDEVSDMKRNVWQEIIRPMLTDRQGKALFIGTPKGKNHFWELFIKGQKKEDGFSSYKFTTEDNPYIPRSEIVEAKSQLSERVFNQEFLASFEDFTGLIWPEFEQAKHVIDAFEIPRHWERIGTLDPALTGTTASLQSAIDEDGTLFIFNEYYEQNKRADEVANAIKDKATTWYGDPAGKHKSISKNGILFSFFDEYSDNGMYLLPAQNDLSGINRVAEFFKNGKIKIFRNCKNLINELERYHWSEDRETALGVMEPKPYKANDHLCDCLRYLVMSREEPSRRPEKEMKPFSESHFERMERQQYITEEF